MAMLPILKFELTGLSLKLLCPLFSMYLQTHNIYAKLLQLVAASLRSYTVADAALVVSEGWRKLDTSSH